MDSNDSSMDFLQLREKNEYLESLFSPQDRIVWACTFCNGFPAVTSTSGGLTSRILPHLINDAMGYYLPTIFVDTGFYPIQTYLHINQMKKEKIPIHTYHPTLCNAEVIMRFGGVPEENTPLWDEFLRVVKHEPLQNAFDDLRPGLWIRGLMHWQTYERGQKNFLEFKENSFRLYPFLDWTSEQAMGYMVDNQLPFNFYHYDLTKGKSQKKECKIGDMCGDGEGI